MSAAIQAPVANPPTPVRSAIEAARSLASAYVGDRHIHEALCLASALVASKLHRTETPHGL